MFSFLSLMFSLAFTAKIVVLTVCCVGTGALCLLSFILLYFNRQIKNQKANRPDGKLIVGIFHPYCNAGGGGERVLWVAIQALQKKYPDAEFYIYTGDVEYTPVEILQKVKKDFDVEMNKNVKFIYLTKRHWIEANMYSYFTLLGQAIGSIYLGLEAIRQLNPDIFIDTTGFTFTLPLFKYLGRCKTGCYVHYPTITTQMLKRVSRRQMMYNNRSFIARSPFLSNIKLFYYRIFAWLYSLAGRCSDIAIVNSTFTQEHLALLWNKPLHLVYPPCEVSHLKKIPRELQQPPKIRILSVAQFRPEKDHPLQLQALYELREIIPEEIFEKITLILCGSCRNIDDATRVKDLQDLSKHLSLENNVEFKVNLSYDELLEEFKKAYIGIHTMLDEHFGISVVELMAAGLITIAHRSGGPLLDIIETSEGSRLGFLAVNADEYAAYIKYIISCSDEEVDEIRQKARASVDRFCTQKFEDEFLRAIDPLFR